jgi:multisubunit Na+/H+ antiporter MnhB subunit
MITVSSPVLRRTVQTVGPFAALVAVYLFFAGHNRPGGGFAAGLVLGAVVALRVIVGLQRPNHALTFLAVGGGIVAAVALAPVVFGYPLLDQGLADVTVPVLGKIKSGSAAVFDLGVTLIVVGLMLAVLEGVDASELRGDKPGVVVREDVS